MSRLETLLEILNDEPNDAFTLYAIAMEYKKIDIIKSEEYFKKLIKNHPEYIGTYYQYAQLLLEKNEKSEAEKIVIRGVEVAIQKKDFHAMSELKQLLNKLQGNDYEDE